MSDLARLPSYPSPTTLIARSGIQFLDFGFDPVRLKVREWGFHDTAAGKGVDDLVQLDFDEAHGQYEVVEAGRRRAAERNLVITAKDALAPFLDKWLPLPFLQVRPNNQFREGPSDWARVRVVDLEMRYGAGYRDEQGNRFRAVISVNRKSVHIGMFDTAEEAALAYNKKSKELYGEDGKQNIIKPRKDNDAMME